MLLRNKENYKSIIPDTETEGLNLYLSRPWQLSYLICEGKEIKKVVDKYIWWEDLNISAEAQRITRFNYEEYKKSAEDPKKIYEEFASYLYDPEYLNIGQNILGFDIFMFNILRREIGLSPDWSFIHRTYDTQCLGKFLLYTNPPQMQENRLLWQLQLRNSWEKKIKTSLTNLGKHFGIQHSDDQLHDGLYDVKLNKEVFDKMVYQIEI